jgi:hypothetical protein
MTESNGRAPSNLFMERDAVISDCGRYRYLLRRAWDHTKPRALFVMLNPSTADAEIDDPTIRSCIRISKSWGYGSFEVVNLFAWRSTDPDELPNAPDASGPDNERIVEAAITRCDVVVFAWGAHPFAQKKAQTFRDLVTPRRPMIYCLGFTKARAPKHPLFLKSTTPLQAYTP